MLVRLVLALSTLTAVLGLAVGVAHRLEYTRLQRIVHNLSERYNLKHEVLTAKCGFLRWPSASCECLVTSSDFLVEAKRVWPYCTNRPSSSVHSNGRLW